VTARTIDTLIAATPVVTGHAQREPAKVPTVGRTPPALGPFFWLCAHANPLMRALRPVIVPLAYALAPGVRRAAACNAARIYGPPVSPDAPTPGRRPARFGRRVLDSFYRFSLGLGASARQSRQQLLSRVACVQGAEAYARARAGKRGVVLATAHLGNFELGLAALCSAEPHVYVVFRRDASAVFERHRARLRTVLGVYEVPIDDGLAGWGQLRAALLADHAVVMQGDRAVPGQKHATVPFLGGHLRVPTGPARLAALTGSPLVPCFAVPVAHGRVEVLLGEPIDAATLGVEAATAALARAIEQTVARHPEQWLLLEPAFVEDQARA